MEGRGARPRDHEGTTTVESPRPNSGQAGSSGPHDRTELWLGLLRRLTNEHPDWATWKNVDSAMAGTGDIDSLAPPGSWSGIQATFVDWASEMGFGPVVSCPHILMGPHLVTFEPGADYILQLDVKERATFRGSTLIDVDMLRPLTVLDPRGFRRVRSGADGIIRLCSNGIRPGGEADLEAIRVKRVRELLADDPDGVEAMARHFGPVRGDLLAGVRAVVDGGWDRRAMRRVELWALVRSVAEPRTVARRIWFARVWKHRCPVVRMIREDARRVPRDVDAWLDVVRTNHDVIETGAGPR